VALIDDLDQLIVGVALVRPDYRVFQPKVKVCGSSWSSSNSGTSSSSSGMVAEQ